MGQRPRVVWFTGLSGAGKSTIANLVDHQLLALGKRSALLDGDRVRRGLSRDLGFSDADRTENIRRIAEVARLMVDAGLIVLVAFISPFRADRAMARELFEEGEFIESMSMPRSPWPNCVIRRGCTSRPVAASCRISQASTRRTKRRSHRICTFLRSTPPPTWQRSKWSNC